MIIKYCTFACFSNINMFERMLDIDHVLEVRTVMLTTHLSVSLSGSFFFKLMHGVHTMCTETAAISHNASYGATKQCCKCTSYVGIKKARCKGKRSFRITCDMSTVNPLKSRE